MMDDEAVLREIDALNADILALREKNPEHFRREPSTMDSIPLKDTAIPDYSTAGGLIDRGKSHLDESIPNGQRRRTETAYAQLLRGVMELGVWLRAKGYDV
jgi:hypothetical protein